MRIVTNNLNVANTLMVKEDFALFSPVATTQPAMADQLAKDARFYLPVPPDFGILGISGIDSDACRWSSITTKFAPSAIIENSRHVMLVVDHLEFWP
ncbi:hypothetical protein OHD50_16090 [Escherichia coli]|nr:hypothetical protein [Escherichia coli]